MNASVTALFSLYLVALVAGCPDDDCKTPKITEGEEGGRPVKGPAYKCNIVLICALQGRGDVRMPVENLVDPIIIDRGRPSWNEARCRWKAQQDGLIGSQCRAEASPTLICLDVDASTGGAVPGTTTGVIVTVGVGAAGDFPQNYQGGEGAGGSSADDGDSEDEDDEMD